MTISLKGKTALVTGGGAGIGRATSIAFASAGANVVVADVDRSGAKETVAMMGDLPGTGIVVVTDVSSARANSRRRPIAAKKIGTVSPGSISKACGCA